MVSTTQKVLTTRLRELRKIHGLTQLDFAAGSSLSYKHYQAIEAGGKKDLRLSTLERLAKAYGITVWELLAPPLPQTSFRNAKRARRTSKSHYR